MLDCVVENSPEKGEVDKDADSVDETDGPFFSNPLGEASLEDVALNYLIATVHQFSIPFGGFQDVLCI